MDYQYNADDRVYLRKLYREYDCHGYRETYLFEKNGVRPNTYLVDVLYSKI